MRTDHREQPSRGMTPFAHWIRTGRWVPAQIADPALEVKFNPYHDPRNGRFTFKYGGVAAEAMPSSDHDRAHRGNGGWGSGGFTGGGGGSVGGGGATGDGYWMNDREVRAFRRRHPDRTIQPYASRPGDTLARIAAAHRVDEARLRQLNNLALSASIKPGTILALPKAGGGVEPPKGTTSIAASQAAAARRSELRRATKNGYHFDIDSADRTREAKGNLHLATTAERSRTNQKRAGGADRRRSDDGGHFIAARFDGPTDAFNHFAQDANFNRGRYRAIEGGWAKDLHAGKHVSVDIKASYASNSQRPHSLIVNWITNGKKHYQFFLNESKVKSHGR